MAEFESCDKCKYNEKSETEYPCNQCIHNATDEFKPMTRADKIRSMSDEELHNFIRAIRCCTMYGDDCGYPFCHSMKGNLCNGIKDNNDEELLKWLQSEAE